MKFNKQRIHFIVCLLLLSLVPVAGVAQDGFVRGRLYHLAGRADRAGRCSA